MSTTDKKFSGWLVFIGCFLLNTFATATISGTAALFMNPICTELGFSLGTYSLINLISALCSAGGAMWYAPKLAKGNINKIMTISAIITAATFIALGFSTQLWQFFVFFGICNVTVAALTQLPTSMLLTSWFEDKRSTVMSIAFVGNSVGTMVWSLIFGKIMAADPHGWATCYIIGGIAVAVVVIPVSLFLIKKNPQMYGQEPYRNPAKKAESSEDAKVAAPKDSWEGVTQKVATKSSAYLFFIISILLVGIMVSGVGTHVINFVVTPLEQGGGGWNLNQGSLLQASFSMVTTILMAVLIGPIFDKIGAPKAAILSCIFAMLGLGCLFAVSQTGNLYVGFGYVALYGLSAGLSKLYASLMVSVLFGTKEYSKIYSLVNLFFLVGCALGSVITGVIAQFAGYAAAWITYIVLMAIVIVCINAAVSGSKKLRAEYPNEAVAETVEA